MTAVTGPVIAHVREMGVPLLAAVLVGACAAKLVRMLRTGSLSAGLGPTELFPRGLRGPAAMTVCAAELCLGVALILTAPRAGLAPVVVRLTTGIFFLVATCALVELRGRRPDIGCGCFGDLSTRPVGLRSVARAGLLAAAALASLGVPRLRLPPPGRGAVLDLVILLAEALVLTALSPEAAEVLVRLGYSEPCEFRVVPPQRVLSALHRSTAWRKHAHVVNDHTPVDMWRELCWWYVVYPAREQGQRQDIVFAVQMKPHRPAVYAATLSGREQQAGPAGDVGTAPPELRSATF